MTLFIILNMNNKTVKADVHNIIWQCTHITGGKSNKIMQTAYK
jgi:hypothetical protein